LDIASPIIITIIMPRFLTACIVLLAGSANAFQVKPRLSISSSALFSKNSNAEDATQQQAFPVGTFVEFQEKSREHVGKIESIEHKGNGAARYHVVDSDGNSYDIPDKSVHFAMSPPNSPGAASKLFDQFIAAHDASDDLLQSKLDISPELLEIAWEEYTEGEGDHMMTPNQLVELIHSHAASAIEKYIAWKFLKTDMAHIFFKEIKDHGRVVSFKAKARKAVEVAKQAFCNSHADNDLCLV
jgi:hypothetical protein